MCVIAISTKGIELPDEDTLQNMWIRNPDGAGIMFAYKNKVHIEKGFMRYDSFYNRLQELDRMYHLKDLSVILHFRITTHGGTKPENTHPFPITDSIGMLKKLKCTTKLGVAHNGIIDITPRAGISDTMEYIASQLAPLSRGVPDFYKNQDLMVMVSNAIDGSRMAFMNEKGEIYTIGNFVEDKGIRYSNRSFERFKTFRDPDYSYWTSDAWEAYEKYASYRQAPLMWLDESKGEIAVDTDGKACWTDDFAIDKDGHVYKFDYEFDAMIPCRGFRAYDSELRALKYNENSEMICNELILEHAYNY